jgi:hypothetical protein
MDSEDWFNAILTVIFRLFAEKAQLRARGNVAIAKYSEHAPSVSP